MPDKQPDILTLKTSILYSKEYSKVAKQSQVSPLSVSVFKVELERDSQTTEVLQTTSREHVEICVQTIGLTLKALGINTNFSRDVLPTVEKIQLPVAKKQMIF